ncbi:impact, putative [Entamoeba invadens IP1]|uniref:impact, putative n=1 Tax=Entamoeba invadens IP1 TaxID=370355 RepID=UPI0002C3D88C|nr:impact, putative [Entamoeba invadens IP1]ELP93818.1 impact, putative [Entamoeba invadens IP1]|eukprot:XP_004260589.1 impact, putative [Entamoeba invadens IP1]
MDETGANVEQQNDEYDTLRNIYDHNDQINFNKIDTNRYRICITFSTQCMIILFYTLPSCYPSEGSPLFMAKTKRNWLSDGQLNSIVYEAERISAEYKGELCIFPVVDRLMAADFLSSISAKVYPDEPPVNLESDKKSDIQNAGMARENDDNLAKTLEISGIKVFAGVPLVDRKSKFIAFVARVHSEKETQLVFDELWKNKKISIATHNIQAYRININGTISCDFDDDGEHAAGKELLRMLEQINAENVCVMVSRWFGGILLGPDRFKHIVNTARDALFANNLVDRNEKPKKHK